MPFSSLLGIIPAYAGSTGFRDSLRASGADHPRIRGEHFGTHRVPIDVSGSSPHTRGALPGELRRGDGDRIIPAYAGSTAVSAAGRSGRRDHPRIRGEHENLPAPGQPGFGSSPHTRGAPYLGRRLRRYGSDHPRIRGEHTKGRIAEMTKPGSSPHTRGALQDPTEPSQENRIIPAYAGSTLCQQRLSSAGGGSSPHTRGAPVDYEYLTTYYEDHPRIRGEHKIAQKGKGMAAGSSPHTRGARLTGQRRDPGIGIIPAYAGSTALAYPDWQQN